MQHGSLQKSRKARFSVVDFCRELQATDKDKFRPTLYTGLARAKAFGCGLLMVKRTTMKRN